MIIRKRLAVTLMALAMTAYWTAPAAAQLLYGSLTGLVEDSSGGSVPNSTITITNKGTGQTYEAKTDEAGRYTIQNILPGEYGCEVHCGRFSSGDSEKRQNHFRFRLT